MGFAQRAVVLSAAALAALVTPAATGAALANVNEIQCSSSGFTGVIRLSYTPGPFGTLAQAKVTDVYYKLFPGDSSSDQNNVGYADNGVLPARTAYTAYGIRDNAFHVLSTTDYTRGSGTVTMNVTFDRFGTDPNCTASKYF
ncbi:MAG: hypothetical protein ACTHQ3_09085 [Motilibacteraceae bacterium]